MHLGGAPHLQSRAEILRHTTRKRNGDRYVTVGPVPNLAIPTTLHNSLMARLDRFSGIKEIAQIGAAIGQEFTYGLLAAVAPISGAALQAALEQFSEAELIFGWGEPPDSTYIFKHALLQDAAYASLLRGTRQRLHLRIADALKAQVPDLAETQPQLIAHHLAQAGQTEPAIDYLRRAGHRAIERSASVEAIGHLKRAQELLQSLPDRLERKRTALELQVMQDTRSYMSSVISICTEHGFPFWRCRA